jgi:hypothetical protein
MRKRSRVYYCSSGPNFVLLTNGRRVIKVPVTGNRFHRTRSSKPFTQTPSRGAHRPRIPLSEQHESIVEVQNNLGARGHTQYDDLCAALRCSQPRAIGNALGLALDVDEGR